MPVPYDKGSAPAPAGAAGFLRFVDEEGGSGIRAALFIASPQDVPLEFCFTRADFRDSVLWRQGEARRHAIASLMDSLFRSAMRTPSVVVGLAEEIPPLVLMEDLKVRIPLCRVSNDPAPRRGASEEIEQIGASLFAVWGSEPPGEGSEARRLFRTLMDRPNPLEPFGRVADGIAEAYRDR